MTTVPAKYLPTPANTFQILVWGAVQNVKVLARNWQKIVHKAPDWQEIGRFWQEIGQLAGVLAGYWPDIGRILASWQEFGRILARYWQASQVPYKQWQMIGKCLARYWRVFGRGLGHRIGRILATCSHGTQLYFLLACPKHQLNP